ncbi:glycosyltransferase family 4 protein [Cryptosporangium phraense]|uniref:Glycosyltransferase family 4 protein n=1 Tax=Cryptosporangium phraense TaxID=2593070 RepID=A0A545AVF1_9ACTN|nr:glycosyltransferase family 4 protein [Cryptosporangium phraense]TQS44575.1 glycosyltransferase family 4 protein [Cryptosporangium phraense]
MKTLLVTNDFPPRPGGIQTFVHQLAVRQPADSLVVYTSDWKGAEEFDAQQPFPVVRDRSSLLLPTPGAAKKIVATAMEHGCTSAWYGAAAPLGLLAPTLTKHTGITWQVAQTHGHEAGWAALPGARQLLSRIADGVDVITYLGNYTRSKLEGPVKNRAQLVHLPGGVNTSEFHPDVDATEVRKRYGLTDRPTIVCVSRLVPRKGQDQLIRALPAIRKRAKDAALLLVSGGPYREKLQKLAAEHRVTDHVKFTGSVPWAELPAHYAAGDVFAMPCRTRRGGLDVEGLGIVYLEASATGLPVIAGDSGGAPDAVLEGETGYVVGGRDVDALIERASELLENPEKARGMGKAGRAWVERDWHWDTLAARMSQLLSGPDGR